LTDPSYCAQIVVMTYPLIGNYGYNDDDVEALDVHAAGLVVRELCDEPSHRASLYSGREYVLHRAVPTLTGVDTRRLTRSLRLHGTMLGMITCGAAPVSEIVEQLRAARPVRDQVRRTTPARPHRMPGDGRRIALLDFGAKLGTVRSLRARGCDITVWPAYTHANEILASHPEGVMMSNGPGDPENLPEIVTEVRKLLGRVPLFGICLGHQMLCLACGARTSKLPFGHRGANHPVRQIDGGRVYMTTQNHGYVVSAESLVGTDLQVTHVNQNDGTLEGVRHRSLPAFSVQYHPEARPGPDDSDYLFDDFLQMIDEFWERGAAHAQAR
ncbi:MAG: carbamoyl phosphate synthase small subunit, partial [Firmicutes bacterium]|nr:carbamoyl phosphate synthase small subunit [Bacillota bacterium]